MRILIYGFKPYAHYTDNITERVLARITATSSVIKKVYEVSFDADMFNNTLARIRPDRVLGLGQHPRSRKLRLERRAINLRKDVGSIQMPITKNGPASRSMKLRLPQTALTTVTYDAGSYVCNYSMYLTGQYCERTGARAGFIHVPRDMDLAVVTVYVKQALHQILDSP